MIVEADEAGVGKGFAHHDGVRHARNRHRRWRPRNACTRRPGGRGADKVGGIAPGKNRRCGKRQVSARPSDALVGFGNPWTFNLALAAVTLPARLGKPRHEDGLSRRQRSSPVPGQRIAFARRATRRTAAPSRPAFAHVGSVGRCVSESGVGPRTRFRESPTGHPPGLSGTGDLGRAHFADLLTDECLSRDRLSIPDRLHHATATADQPISPLRPTVCLIK